MAQKTLQSMVASALDTATRHLKTASAVDAVVGKSPADIDKLAAEMAPESKNDDKKPPFMKKDDDKKKDESEKRASIETAEKLAMALGVVSEIFVNKVAERSPIDAPGPKVMAADNSGQAKHPTPPKAKVEPPKSGVGPVGHLADNADVKKTAGWTKNPEAAKTVIATKLAQVELLNTLGQVEAATDLLTQVEGIAKEAGLKLAQDPSSPQPNIPANNGSGGRVLALMPSVPSGPVPGSAEAIAAMTKAQAKNPTIREAGDHLEQKPQVDNAVAATQVSTHGQKVSSLLTGFAEKQKAAAAVDRPLPEKPGFFENQAGKAQGMRENVPLQAGLSGTIGAAYGGGLGALAAHSAGGGKNVVIPAALLGALAGGTGLGMLGRAAAHGEQDHRRRLEQTAAATPPVQA